MIWLAPIKNYKALKLRFKGEAEEICVAPIKNYKALKPKFHQSQLTADFWGSHRALKAYNRCSIRHKSESTISIRHDIQVAGSADSIRIK